MKKVVKIINEVKTQTGKGSKERKTAILLTNKDNEILRESLRISICPLITTKIKKLKYKKDVSAILPNRMFTNILDFYNFLTNECTGKDIDVANIKNFIKDFSTEEQETLISVVCQELSVGMSKELNAIWKDLILIPLAQKGHNIKDYLSKVDGQEIAITLKLDGCRCTFEDGKFMSYNRKPYEGLVDLSKQMAKLSDKVVYDGELRYYDSTGKMTRQEVKRRTDEILSCDDTDKKDIDFILFDHIPSEDFGIKVNLENTFKIRREALDLLGKTELFSTLPNVKICDLLAIQTGLDNIQYWLDYAKENDYEGVMINLMNAPYEYTRSQNIFKLKTLDSFDLLIEDVYEGEKDFKGTLGGFNCLYKGFPVNVGGGSYLTKEKRKEIWDNPSLFIGKVAEVTSFGESKNKKNDNISLSIPQLVSIRFDKVKAETE